MSEELTTSGTFKIRPAGRHILTIGRDLIQDPCAAVVELVKNAYDADASQVSISIKKNEKNNHVEITIEDDGVGMTRSVVVNRWMVPSTDGKRKNQNTHSGRIVQGRKGIGRFSASVLGNELLLETVSKEKKEKTSVYIDWSLFEKAEYLSDVDVLIESKPYDGLFGTRLSITGSNLFLEEWKDTEFKKLRRELRKVISPIKEKDAIDFHIYLRIEGFSYKDGFFHEEVLPYPLFGLYDYRIHGKIDSNGIGKLLFENQKALTISSEVIDVDLQKKTECGSIDLDIRVYDRDKESIEDLIGRGLKDSDGNYLGKLEARKLLNENCGIGVYRNGFRIRPLGDASFDWLELNRQRIQNPSRKIGSDQVIGVVNIDSEELSGLIETSARDGLKKNFAYNALIAVARIAIGELETRRFTFRYKTGLGKKKLKVERDLEKLLSFESLRTSVAKTFEREGISSSASAAVIEAIDVAEKEKNEIVSSLKELVAVYQGQATLGKIMNVVMHEGRKSLSFFNNQIPLFEKAYENYLEGKEGGVDKIYKKVLQFADKSKNLTNLFKKIDSLAMGRRGQKKTISLVAMIKDALDIFSSELESIKISINCNEKIVLECWPQDVSAVFANLIENSIYWIKNSDTSEGCIEINVSENNGKIEFIDFKDNGPGICQEFIDSEVIFEPNFSTKPLGTGLGLSIAGEAAERFGFKLMAKFSDSGAYFRLKRKGD